VLLTLADAAPAVHVGGGSSLAEGMRAVPLPRCTVTSVVAVTSLPRVLGAPDAKPAVHRACSVFWLRNQLCGCGRSAVPIFQSTAVL